MVGLEIFSKIKKLGQDRSKKSELEAYVSSININELCALLPKRIISSDGSTVIASILEGLAKTNDSTKYKYKIIEVVLATLRKESISVMHCTDLLSPVQLELPWLPTSALVKLIDVSIETLTADSDVNMIWRDILPACLSLVMERGGSVTHCGSEMLAATFKSQCVKALCQSRWNERAAVQLVAMFREMKLPKDDHHQVVTKLCSNINRFPPDSLPPLVHQLLGLCRSQHIEIVLTYLNYYFNSKLYNQLEYLPLEQRDSESTNFDEDITTYTSEELIQSLSTCLYHGTQGAACLDVLRKHLQAWPRGQLARSPFLMCLSLSTAQAGSQYKDVCLGVVRSSIQQKCLDSIRMKESSWYRSVTAVGVHIKAVLRILVKENIHHHQLTASGLVDLAFTLLSTSPLLGRERLSHQMWYYGRGVLIRMASAQSQYTKPILESLQAKMLGDAASRQYSDTLALLCKLAPLSIMECTPQLQSILENCTTFSSDWLASSLVLEAVQPMINVSSRIRDTLVMVCRKALFSRDSSMRRLAVSGFLSLLRNVKLTGSLPSSQNTGSSYESNAHSYLTQISIDLHATQSGQGVSSRIHNETVCLEVVSILRRCFGQDGQVKELLYSELYDCTKDKPSLHKRIIELLMDHLNLYIPEEEGGIGCPPLTFEKCMRVRDEDVILQEPLGHLLNVIQKFLTHNDVDQDTSNDGDLFSQANEKAEMSSALNNLMDKICKRMIKWEDRFLDMDPDSSAADLSPETCIKMRTLKAQIAISCIEALMAYRINSWNIDSESPATKIMDLLKIQQQIVDCMKGSPKKVKAVPKKGTKKSDDASVSQKSQTGPSQKGRKVSKAGVFKQSACLWDLSVCRRTLVLLYGTSVQWSSEEHLTQIRTKREFHRFTLTSVTSVLHSVQVTRHRMPHIHTIGRILHDRCLVRFADMCEFNEPTALACLEAYKECLLLPTNGHIDLNLNAYLCKILEQGDVKLSDNVAKILNLVRLSLEHLDAEDSSQTEEDLMSKKISSALVQIVSVTLDKLAKEGAYEEQCEELVEEIQKYTEYVRTSSKCTVILLSSVLTATHATCPSLQFLEEVLKNILLTVGEIGDEEEEPAPYPGGWSWQTAATAQAALSTSCLHLTHSMEDVQRACTRAQETYVATHYVTREESNKNERDLKELEKAIVVRLCQITTCVSLVCQCRTSAGLPSDRALAAATKLHQLIATFAKHLSARVGKIGEHSSILYTIKFEKLLKLCGKKLSSEVDLLILHVERGGSTRATRVMRDTRLIPRLVYELEQCTKNVIVLGKKCKMNLQQYLSHGTARDFRIQASALKEALGQKDATNIEEQQEDVPIEEEIEELKDRDEDETSTVVLSPDEDEEVDEEVEVPARVPTPKKVGGKRRKLH